MPAYVLIDCIAEQHERDRQHAGDEAQGEPVVAELMDLVAGNGADAP
jgi:hypothetical protein